VETGVGMAEQMRDNKAGPGQAFPPERREDALTYAEAVIATVREPLVVLEADLRVRTANRSFSCTAFISSDTTRLLLGPVTLPATQGQSP
jgi:hypothetical protein